MTFLFSQSILGGKLLRQDSFDRYDVCRDFSADGPDLSGEVRWDLLMPEDAGGPSETPSLEVTGLLIGGCLDCIAKLIGTPFDGTAEFLERYGDEGILWYFDPFLMNADTMYLTLLQMKYCGYFRTTRAVIFGRVLFTEGSTDNDYLELLSRIFDVPVIWNADIGHVKPCMTLINGAVGRIRCSGGRGSLEMALI